MSHLLKNPSIDFSRKEWYILVFHHKLGPFSLRQLKKNRDFGPDTLVWKQGFETWIPARYVPDCQWVFKDDPESISLHPEKKEEPLIESQGALILTFQKDPYYYLFWIFLILCIYLYTHYLIVRGL